MSQEVKKNKKQITIKIDESVLAQLKVKSWEKHAGQYQTLINSILVNFLEKQKSEKGV